MAQLSRCFMSQNLPLTKNKGPPHGSPFSSDGWRLLGGHARFDVRQGAIDTGKNPLLAHQRHHGVGDARRECPGGLLLLGSHARFDIRQSAVDAGEYALLAHQRHHGVDGGGEITPDR